MECPNLSFLHLNWEFKLRMLQRKVHRGRFPFPFFFSITCLTMTLLWQPSQISVGRLILWGKSHGELPSCIQPNLLMQHTAAGNLTNLMGDTIAWSPLLWQLLSGSRVETLLQPSTSQCLLSISFFKFSILAVPLLSFYSFSCEDAEQAQILTKIRDHV